MDLSIVIPLLNEEGNIEALHQQLTDVLSDSSLSCEIIMVDDGSTDNSFEILRRLAQTDVKLKVIRLRRNFGQTAAMSAGFDYAEGQIIITLDADLQNDPKDIPVLLAKINEGYDIVSGWRKDRQDPFWTRRFPSLAANRLTSIITGVHLHDYGCTLKAYRAEVVKNLRLYGEMHRFIPAVASGMGVRIAEVPVNHHPRTHGNSKYGLSRTIRVVLDLITLKFQLSYSTRPMQVFGIFGLFCLGVGFVLLGYLGWVRIIFQEAIGNRPLLWLAVLLEIIGVQFFMLGLLGEMMVRTQFDIKGKPIYSVKEVVNERLDKR